MSSAEPETQSPPAGCMAQDHGRETPRLLGSRVFPGVPEAIGVARAYLKRLLADRPTATDALLLASEIATNAIRHSRSKGRTFTVTVLEAADRIRVEITDLGGDAIPAAHDDVDAVNGRGLLLVAAVATRWGVDGGADGRTVWFVLAP